ncbi:hypothetical protein COO59_20370, partial [Mixta theicola]
MKNSREADPTGVTRRYRYDSLGQLSEADEPGIGITRYQYDDLGFPCAITESGAASLLLRHSVRGNPEQKTDGNGAVIHYFWDRKDRLAGIRELDGCEIRIEYVRKDRPFGRSHPSAELRSPGKAERATGGAWRAAAVQHRLQLRSRRQPDAETGQPV